MEHIGTGEVGDEHTEGDGHQQQRFKLLYDAQVQQHAGDAQHDEAAPVAVLGKEVGTFDHPFLNGVMPKLPYPHELCCAGVWHSTEEKIDVLKALGFHDFDFYQTLLKNPMYTNEDVEDVVPGYQSGGYVAIIAHK